MYVFVVHIDLWDGEAGHCRHAAGALGIHDALEAAPSVERVEETDHDAALDGFFDELQSGFAFEELLESDYRLVSIRSRWMNGLEHTSSSCCR